MTTIKETSTTTATQSIVTSIRHEHLIDAKLPRYLQSGTPNPRFLSQPEHDCYLLDMDGLSRVYEYSPHIPEESAMRGELMRFLRELHPDIDRSAVVRIKLIPINDTKVVHILAKPGFVRSYPLFCGVVSADGGLSLPYFNITTATTDWKTIAEATRDEMKLWGWDIAPPLPRPLYFERVDGRLHAWFSGANDCSTTHENPVRGTPVLILEKHIRCFGGGHNSDTLWCMAPK